MSLKPADNKIIMVKCSFTGPQWLISSPEADIKKKLYPIRKKLYHQLLQFNMLPQPLITLLQSNSIHYSVTTSQSQSRITLGLSFRILSPLGQYKQINIWTQEFWQLVSSLLFDYLQLQSKDESVITTEILKHVLEYVESELPELRKLFTDEDSAAFITDGATDGGAIAAHDKDSAAFITVGAATGGAIAAPVVTVAVAQAIGFTTTGIAAGSTAASMMSAVAVANCGAIAAGSTVATLQAVGATGSIMTLGVGSIIAIPAIGATVVGLTGYGMYKLYKRISK